MSEVNQLVGLAGVPTIEAFVNWLKELGLSSKLAPLVALISGIGLNLLLAWLLGNDFKVAIGIGLVAGFGASAWYEAHK